MLKHLFSILPGWGKHNYRSDIDGLRAIACLAVVLYHAFPDRLHGGFVGVDIFFVISGFLISSIIYRNLFNSETPGKVNIVDFYIRRVRRIFPALIAVLITTLVLGWFVLLPDEYKLLGKHAFGGSVYINNFMLFNESGDYFNAASNAKPLLHLWSLGVEEQFYLIFPIFLYVLYKTNLNFILCLTLFTVGSFCLNKYNINTNQQTSAFYLPWCRFWELSIGAILAYTVNYHSDFVLKAKSVLTDNIIASHASKIIFRKSNDDLRQNLINNAISLAGIVIIIFGIIAVKNDSTFPGTKALIPVFGSLMIIGAGKTAVINKYLLSNPVMVFIGLISYPLYLWHWPLLSMAYICADQQPTSWIRICAVLIAVILSVLTYFFIEPPLRYGKYPKVKATGLFFTLFMIGGIGFTIFFTDGLKFNLNLKEREIFSQTSKYKMHRIWILYDQYIDNCKETLSGWPKNTCGFQSKAGMNDIALIGSSHAGHLFYGLQDLANKKKHSIALLSDFGQSCFYDLYTPGPDRRSLYVSTSKAYSYVQKQDNIKVVLLADFIDKSIDYYKLVNHPEIKDPASIYEIAVKKSLNLLKNKKVIIILDSYRLPFDVLSCNKRPLSFKRYKHNCKFSPKSSPTFKNRVLINNVIKNVSKNYSNVKLFDLSQIFCNNEECTAKIGDYVLFLDNNHLNPEGSKYVAPFIFNMIDKTFDEIKLAR